MTNDKKNGGLPGGEEGDGAPQPGRQGRGRLAELVKSIEASADAAWVMDRERRILAANEAASRLVGRPACEMAGRYCYELVHSSGRPAPECPLERSLSGKRRETAKFCEDGRRFEAVVCPAAEDGESSGAVVHELKVAASRHNSVPAAQGAAKGYERSLILAMRDLRDPLVNTEDFSHYLLKELAQVTALLQSFSFCLEARYKAPQITEAAVRKSVELLLDGIRKLHRSVDGMRELTAPRRQGAAWAADLNFFMDKVVLGLAEPLKEAGAAIKVSALPACKVPPAVVAHIFTCLLSNVLERRRSGRKLEISLSGEADGSKVVYTLSDNGAGMTKSELAKTWHLFSCGLRAGGVKNGAIVSLAASRRLAEACSGQLWVESEEGKGSTFFLEMPA
jgi:PAS domain S-box-containing protein